MKRLLLLAFVGLVLVGGIVGCGDSQKKAKERRAALLSELKPVIGTGEQALGKKDYNAAFAEFQKVIDTGLDDGIIWYEYAICYEQINGDDEKTLEVFDKAYSLLKAQHPESVKQLQELEKSQGERKKLVESLGDVESLGFNNIRVSGSALSATYTGTYWNFDETCRSTASNIWKLLNKLPSITSIRIHTVIPGEDHYGNKKVFDYGVLEFGPDETSYIRKYQTDTDYAFGDATNFGLIILHYADNGLPRRP